MNIIRLYHGTGKINKDTYLWGTTEQLVYNKKGYIYFRNGIVTSILER